VSGLEVAEVLVVDTVKLLARGYHPTFSERRRVRISACHIATSPGVLEVLEDIQQRRSPTGKKLSQQYVLSPQRISQAESGKTLLLRGWSLPPLVL
jgi:hypothetical protein